MHNGIENQAEPSRTLNSASHQAIQEVFCWEDPSIE